MGCCGSSDADEYREPEEKKRLLAEPALNNFCHKCGRRLYAGSQFCSSCGTSVPAEGEEPSDGVRKRGKEISKSTGGPPKEGWREKEERLKKEREERLKQDQVNREAWAAEEEKKRREKVEKRLREPSPRDSLGPKSRSEIVIPTARKGGLLGESEEVMRKRQNLERMDSQQQLYGVDLELDKKAKQKMEGDEERVKMCIDWIEQVTGEKRVGDFPDCLKSGKMLCALANTIRPGIIDHVNDRPIPLLERENIQAYLKACDRMGIKKQDLFGISDLYEEKYLPAVIQNISAVALLASHTPSFTGPLLMVFN